MIKTQDHFDIKDNSTKFMVHATGSSNLNNILTTKFLANPSLAIVDANQPQSFKFLSLNWGRIFFITNPNYILNNHQTDIYPCDSASKRLPKVEKAYFNRKNGKFEINDLLLDDILQNEFKDHTFEKLDMQIEMYERGLLKFYITVDNKNIELTKENVQQFFKDKYGNYLTRLSEANMRDNLELWEGYQLSSAICKSISLTDLNNSLYRLNINAFKNVIHNNQCSIMKQNDTAINNYYQVLHVKNDKQLTIFNKHKQLIDDLFFQHMFNPHIHSPLNIYDVFVSWFLYDEFRYCYENIGDNNVFATIIVLSSFQSQINNVHEKLYLDSERFPQIIQLLNDIYEDLNKPSNMQTIFQSKFFHNEDEKMMFFETLSYFAYKIGYEYFTTFYEVKVKECLDINSDNFPHVLLPTSTDGALINHFEKLNIKPVLYADLDQTVKDLIQKNQIQSMEGFKLNGVAVK
jgi:hypothetical protein